VIEEGERLATTLNDMSDNLPKSRGRCFDIGTWGGCGVRCPVFIEGDCSEPQEMDIEEMKAEYDKDELTSILELYECFK